jgi:hypothetical protein
MSRMSFHEHYIASDSWRVCSWGKRVDEDISTLNLRTPNLGVWVKTLDIVRIAIRHVIVNVVRIAYDFTLGVSRYGLKPLIS